MRKALLLFLVLIPIALANITTTTENLPANYTIEMEIESQTENDAYNFVMDDWLNLNNPNPTAGGYNLTITLNIQIPIFEEGNYTKNVFYNSTYFLDNQTSIEIEIINSTKGNTTRLETEKNMMEECISRKTSESNIQDENLKNLQAQHDCLYEITDKIEIINNTITIIENQTIIEEIPVIDTETKDKITNVETTTAAISTEITNLKTDMTNLKTELIEKITQMQENITQSKTEENTNINWGILGIITLTGIIILGGLAYYINKKRGGEIPQTKPPKPPKEEPTKKTIFKKKEPKPEFDRLT